jgi:hypothetical protein
MKTPNRQNSVNSVWLWLPPRAFACNFRSHSRGYDKTMSRRWERGPNCGVDSVEGRDTLTHGLGYFLSACQLGGSEGRRYLFHPRQAPQRAVIGWRLFDRLLIH